MTAADPVSLLHDCRDLLKRVDEGTRWAYSAGWYPGHRWVGEPPGREMYLAHAEEDRRDHVPGAPHDIGLGDYKARAAVRRVGPKLTQASRFLHDACQLVAAASDESAVPSSVSLEAVVPLSAIIQATTQIDAQLAYLLSRDTPTQARKYVAGRIVQARTNLATLVAGLDRWASRVPESKTLPVRLCKTCTTRPCPVRNGRIVSKECDTCATWRYRHKGQTRPPSLDDRDREAPKDAQERRIAAGEGWGWS